MAPYFRDFPFKMTVSNDNTYMLQLKVDFAHKTIMTRRTEFDKYKFSAFAY